MSNLEYHVLLALAAERLHGYAIAVAVAAESGGALSPPAGTLYRVLARLLTAGPVREAASPDAAASHPGLARRYYALTASGRAALAAEADRLRRTAAMARRRLDVAAGRS